MRFIKVAGPTRHINSFDNTFPVVSADEFTGGAFADRYTAVASGDTNTAYGSGTCTFSGAGTGDALAVAANIPIAPYCTAELTVSAQSNAIARVGFYKDANNYMWMLSDGGAIVYDSKINGSQIQSATSRGTPTGTYTIRFQLCYSEVILWLVDDNGERALWGFNLSQPTDLRKLDQWQSGWKPAFGMESASDAEWSGTATAFRAFYTGAVGLRDFKPVTYLNGNPYRNGTKVYFLSTCATGEKFITNHTSLLSIDVDTYAMELEALFFFNIASTDRVNPSATKDTCTSLYGGQMLRDEANNKWVLVVNGWGYGDAGTGVQLWLAETTENVLSGKKVLDLDAFQLAPSGVTGSLYDNAQYQDDDGTWRVVTAQTDPAVAWTTYNATLLEGPSLTELTQTAIDTERVSEGNNWCRIGGAWWATSGGNGGPWLWDDELASQGQFAGYIDKTGMTIIFGGYGSHMPIIPINRRNGFTQYLMLLFDESKITTTAEQSLNASKGAIAVEVSQFVSGTEF